MLIYPGPERRARRRFQRRLTPFSSVLPFHICNEVMIPVCDITLQTAEQPACRDCSHWLSLLGAGVGSGGEASAGSLLEGREDHQPGSRSCGRAGGRSSFWSSGSSLQSGKVRIPVY